MGQAFLLADILQFTGHALLVSTPARINTKRRTVKDSLDAPDLTILDLKQLGELPGPVDAVMIEEAKSKDDPLLLVHRHKSPVPDP